MATKLKTGDCLLFSWDMSDERLSFNKIFGIGITWTQRLEFARTHNVKELLNSKQYTKWTHVGMVSRVTGDKIYIAEQLWKYQNEPVTQEIINSWINAGILKVRRPTKKLKNLWNICNERVGDIYDILDIGNIFLRAFTLFARKTITNLSIIYKGAIALIPFIKGIEFVRSYISKPTPERTICTEANGRNYLEASEGKLDVAKEFELESPDLLMPMHFALSKQFKDI